MVSLDTRVEMESQSLPKEFDQGFYRDLYADLRFFTDEELEHHYQAFGRSEGRTASYAALRENFLRLIPDDAPALEIGPFCNPSLLGANVSYFDVLDADGLRSRAEKIHYPVILVPNIEFVAANGSLEVVDRVFGAVFSSHCVEHQPDLIRHFVEVERILRPGGRYYLIIPDKRFCFDYGLPESHLGDVLDAWHRAEKQHSMKSVASHRALTTHNDQVRHWQGDHFDEGWGVDVTARATAGMRECQESKGAYIDVHAWQFTPQSFANLMRRLIEMRFFRLEIERVYDTPRNRNEFTAILRKPE